MDEAVQAESQGTLQPTPSVHDRLKAILSHSSEASEAETDDSKASSGGVAPVVKKPAAERPAPNEQVEGDDAPEPEKDPEPQADDETEGDDAQSEGAQPKSLKELADAIGWDIEKMSDLELPVKIDGKEGTARLRDLVKSYQLDGHINQKLQSFDNDRKSWETKRAEGDKQIVDRLLKLDAGVKTLERALESEFHGIDWQKLSGENPLEYNSKWVQYQQRYAVLNDIAAQIGQEQKQFQEAQQAKAQEYFAEQKKLLEAKVPEWADTTRRQKDKADIVEYLKTLGLSKEEFESVSDHRMLLVVRDALSWNKLQKAKPGTLNKVKAAPKLLKPGTTQSRAAKDALADQKDRGTLKQTGRVRDAVPLIKRRLFGGR